MANSDERRQEELRPASSPRTMRSPASAGLRRRMLPEDGHQWHKYGHKTLMDSSFSRAYYRCSMRNSGCPVKKTVDFPLDKSHELRITYDGQHNHPPSTPLLKPSAMFVYQRNEAPLEALREPVVASVLPLSRSSSMLCEQGWSPLPGDKPAEILGQGLSSPESRLTFPAQELHRATLQQQQQAQAIATGQLLVQNWAPIAGDGSYVGLNPAPPSYGGGKKARICEGSLAPEPLPQCFTPGGSLPSTLGERWPSMYPQTEQTLPRSFPIYDLLPAFHAGQSIGAGTVPAVAPLPRSITLAHLPKGHLTYSRSAPSTTLLRAPTGQDNDMGTTEDKQRVPLGASCSSPLHSLVAVESAGPVLRFPARNEQEVSKAHGKLLDGQNSPLGSAQTSVGPGGIDLDLRL